MSIVLCTAMVTQCGSVKNFAGKRQARQAIRSYRDCGLTSSQGKRIEAVQMARNAVLDQIVGDQKLTSILEDIAHRLEDINPDMIVSVAFIDQ